jgi:hypothetical protein
MLQFRSASLLQFLILLWGAVVSHGFVTPLQTDKTFVFYDNNNNNNNTWQAM